MASQLEWQGSQIATLRSFRDNVYTAWDTVITILGVIVSIVLSVGTFVIARTSYYKCTVIRSVCPFGEVVFAAILALIVLVGGNILVWALVNAIRARKMCIHGC